MPFRSADATKDFLMRCIRRISAAESLRGFFFLLFVEDFEEVFFAEVCAAQAPVGRQPALTENVTMQMIMKRRRDTKLTRKTIAHERDIIIRQNADEFLIKIIGRG